MRSHSTIVTLVATLLLGLAACVPEEALDEPLEEHAEAIRYCPDGEPPPCNSDPDPDPQPPPPPPRDPSRPRRAGLLTLRMDTFLLDAALRARLNGTYISIDTTKNAPYVVSGSRRVCHRQGGDEAFEAAMAECRSLRGAQRIPCIREVNETFPIVCSSAGNPYYSYIAFPPALKSEFPEIQDEVFDLEKIDRDTWYGTITIDLNQIRSVLGQQSVQLYSGGGSGPALLGLKLGVVSGSPTAKCHRDGILPCPDVRLNNMQLAVALTGLRPDPADATRVTFGNVGVDFTFNRDVNNLPEWLVDAWYDLDYKIKSKVGAKLRDAIMARQKGMSDLLTRIVNEYRTRLASHMPAIAAIDEVMADSGYIYVHYTPVP